MPQLTPEQQKEQQKELQEKLKKMSPEELQEFQKQQCIFCQIIANKVHSKKIYEDDKCIAVLDINPAAKGHVLILPKEHYAIMPQIPEPVLGHLFVVGKYLSQAALRVLSVEGTNLFVANGLVAGQKAQHFMIHLIPRKSGDEILVIDEKILDSEMQQKVKTAVQDKLNQYLGIKKEKVAVLEKVSMEEESIEEEPEASELVAEKVGARIEQTKKEKRELDEKKVSAEKKQIKKEKSELAEKKVSARKKKVNRGKKELTERKISTRKKKLKEEESELAEHSNRDVNLDDIANLFK